MIAQSGGAAIFEDFIPRRKLGMLWPLAVIDNSPYEFYRIAPPGVMLVGVGVGLSEFSAHDVERVFAPLDALADQLMERDIDLIMQSGVPLPILIGVEAHDRLVDRLAKRTGKPATSSIIGVAAAARRLGLKSIVCANKWSPEMNAVLAQFVAREGVTMTGVASKVLVPSEFQKMGTDASLDLAWRLGRQAFLDHPEADGLYIGGGAWMVMPMVEALEKEFGRPVICNLNAMIWNTLNLVSYWTPIAGHGRLLASA
jgi:maleate isomerase